MALRRPASWGDWGYAAGWQVVRAMPEGLARRAFGAGARFAARGGGPEQLRKNLARVIGTTPQRVPDELIRASLASYARYWREAFRLPSMDHAALAERLINAGALGPEFCAAYRALAARHRLGRPAVAAPPVPATA